MMSQFDKEEQYLDEQLRNGEISQKEHSEAIKDLQRSYMECARESAQNAYDMEMDDWV